MNTKQKGVVSEYAVVLKAMEFGWGVSTPLGDHLPYDLILDLAGKLVKIQVKHAWKKKRSGTYATDNRRTKTNRRVMKREKYRLNDFDFAVVTLEGSDVFYIFPVTVFTSYAGEIQIVEETTRQRKPKAFPYRNAWQLISQWAAQDESPA